MTNYFEPNYIKIIMDNMGKERIFFQLKIVKGILLWSVFKEIKMEKNVRNL